MVFLGRPEGRSRQHFGVDHRETGTFEQGVTALLGDLALGLVLPVDPAAVLAAAVAELAVLDRWVDVAPEILDQLGVADLLRIVEDAHRFGMTRAPGADRFIARVVGFASGVARFDFDDAGQFFEVGLDAPKTAASENGAGLAVRDVGALRKEGRSAESQSHGQPEKSAKIHVRNSGSASP